MYLRSQPLKVVKEKVTLEDTSLSICLSMIKTLTCKVLCQLKVVVKVVNSDGRYKPLKVAKKKVSLEDPYLSICLSV